MPTGLTYAEMAEREISYWESSSSSSENSDSNNRNRNRKVNASRNNSRPNSLLISHARHNDAAPTTKGLVDDEGGKEVIFDLDPTAMSQLPSHLQHNMREIQRERLARVQRDPHVHIPIRKQQQQQQRNAAAESKEEQDQADKWFRDLLAKFPGAVGMRMKARRRRKCIRARGISSPRPVDLDVLRRAYEGGDQSKEFMEPRHIEDGYPRGDKGVGVEHEKNVDSGHGFIHDHAYAQGHRVHRTASNTDRIYDHSDEVPRRSEPLLSKLDSQYFVGQSVFYEGDPQQGEQDPVKPSSLRRHVHKSMHKLSKAFKKG